MKLSEANINQKLLVIKMYEEDSFIKFGIFDNCEITIIKKIFGNFIILYDNHQYVIKKQLAKNIEVEYVK